ncbi:hypothetical protein AXFE_01650 [Acidithrix ferrooxidans]|uniref:Uncharacterized protein n=1 Tax=Acidithrix ferrooxidans TaxID=1280514 RepID=A0A0D8HPC4_9ACTN|nr:hypothetical protein AXFE_01650 [Acidithrix ferrooxidans]CAG4926006.1 unnamed protein product [Acidithrix sp. C25]
MESFDPIRIENKSFKGLVCLYLLFIVWGDFLREIVGL